MNEGILKLMRVEEYLDLQSHQAAKGEVFHGNDTSLTDWYEEGYEFLTTVIDEIELEAV